MKKYYFSLFTLVLFVALTTPKVHAQQKIGCIDSNELIASMPENATATATIEAKTQEYLKQIEELQVEVNKKYQTYLIQQDSLSPLIRKAKEAEINDMAANIDTFRNAADQEIQNLRNELYKPIIDKATKAIKEVSNEGGFTYIIDIGTRALVFYPEEEPLNILNAVKAKLGIE